MKALRVVVPLLVLLLATPLFATNILYSNLGSGGSGSDPVNGSLIGGGSLPEPGSFRVISSHLPPAA